MPNTNRDAYPEWWYTTQHDAAAKLFEEWYHDKSLAAAKHSLNDTTLAPYYVIKNCILVAGALDNWDEADIWMRAAEQAYTMAFQQASAREDGRSLDALEDLRGELDQVEVFRQEDLAGTTGVRIYDDDENVEEDDLLQSDSEVLEEHIAVAEAENDTQMAAAEAENEVEEEAETVLAIRPAITGHIPTPPTSIPAITVTPAIDSSDNMSAANAGSQRLRRKKSTRFIKGGAIDD